MVIQYIKAETDTHLSNGRAIIKSLATYILKVDDVWLKQVHCSVLIFPHIMQKLQKLYMRSQERFEKYFQNKDKSSTVSLVVTISVLIYVI